MREMKDSGIEWIGNVPTNWKTERLQFHIYEINMKNNPIQTTNVLSLTNKLGVIPYEEKGNQGNKSKENYDEYKVAFPNTIVANSMNILIGSVGISDYLGCISPVYYVFKSKPSIELRFVNYIMQTVQFQKELRRYANGILEIRLRVSADDILKRNVPIPNKQEQLLITNYLDCKCAEIDSIISNIQSQIEALEEYKCSIITETVTQGVSKSAKTRTTSVPWIKTMPNNWRLSRIKYEIIPLSRSVKDTDEVVTCFRDGRVTLRKYRREEGFTISFTEHGYQGVEKGDLVIHGMDTFAGAIGCSECRGKCTPVVHVCRTTGNNRFYMYYLRSLASNNVLWFYANGVRIRSSDFRNYSNLGKFEISVPPISEQNEIVDYLDMKCTKIDNIISEKKQQIETIEEYKKSLIFEYVTGKKEVQA